MCHDVQDESIKEAVHLQGLLPAQPNLARQFHLFLAQVLFLWTMILIGRMFPTTNPITNLTANRPTFSTHSWSVTNFIQLVSPLVED